jgi:Na+-transporting NADH:ubiquinone oxidoreductase subunit NqrE
MHIWGDRRWSKYLKVSMFHKFQVSFLEIVNFIAVIAETLYIYIMVLTVEFCDTVYEHASEIHDTLT